MRIRTLNIDSIVRLKDGRVYKILDVKYRPRVEIKALDLDIDKEVKLKFRDIKKVLYEKPMVDTLIETLPAIGTALMGGFLAGLLKRIEKKEEKSEVKDD